MVNIAINNKKISCPEGTLLLDVALANDIYIPNLCHHPDLRPVGGCRLCVVDIEGKVNVATSCETEVWEGMVVTTEAPRLEKIRSLSLELMLAHHPSTCTECPKYGSCEMQNLLQYMGVTNSRLYPLPIKRTINEKNPLIVHDPVRCIKCGRCVRICRDVRGVEILDFHADEKSSEIFVCDGKQMLTDDDCRFCGACIEVCPTSAIRDAEDVFRESIPKEQALIPCQAECSAHIDIPAYVRLVNQGKYSEAQAVIREKAPFPHTLGYICNHRCEDNCKRGKINDSISIRELKLFAVGNDTQELWRGKGFTKPRTGKKVAVVGSGPCGMTAAYYLNKCGHDVSVFEKQNIPGGCISVGIPEYRLPAKCAQKELGYIIESGINMVYDSEITNAPALKKDFDAVLIAIGASMGKKLMHLQGADLSQVYTAVDMLRSTRLDQPIELGETINIIGGGNVAFDAARTAIRMGKKVNVICMEKDASQADSHEVKEALDEGVILHDSYISDAIIERDGKVSGLQVHKIDNYYFEDETKKLVVVKVPDSYYVISCDSIVFAVGQETGLTSEFGLELNSLGFPIVTKTGEGGRRTSIEGVFAAGDVLSGTKFVIDAIADGRDAASAIDSYLGGDGKIDETLYERVLDPHIGKITDFASRSRETAILKPAEERKDNFMSTSGGLTCEQAHCESERCLQCDLRKSISKARFSTEFIGVAGGVAE